MSEDELMRLECVRLVASLVGRAGKIDLIPDARTVYEFLTEKVDTRTAEGEKA